MIKVNHFIYSSIGLSFVLNYEVLFYSSMSAPGPIRRSNEKKKEKEEKSIPYDRNDPLKRNVVNGNVWYSKFGEKFKTRKYLASKLKRKDRKTISNFCKPNYLDGMALELLIEMADEESARKQQGSLSQTDDSYLHIAIHEETNSVAGFVIYKYETSLAVSEKRSIIVAGKPEHWVIIYNHVTTYDYIPDDIFESYVDTLTEIMEGAINLQNRYMNSGTDGDDILEELEELTEDETEKIYEYLIDNFESKGADKDAAQMEATILVQWVINAGRLHADEYDAKDTIKGRKPVYERVNTLYLKLICASSTWKGHGVAKGLFRELLKQLFEYPFQYASERLQIKLQPADEELAELYESLGFEFPDGDSYGRGENYMYSPDLLENPNALNSEESSTPRVAPVKPVKKS